MKYRPYIITLLVLLLCNNLYAQRETNNWVFGFNSGITFNTTPPTHFNGASLNTNEGSASISDAQGNLLFYTDGVTVWNRNHNVMENGYGLNGNYSSTQSALIIPKPNAPNRYYIFTAPVSWNYFFGIKYSEVDMSLDNGQGALLFPKNTILHSPSSEKLTAVKHANGIDYWVLGHEQENTNRFFAYKITANGVEDTPVISDIGTLHDFSVGYLKIAPNGKKVATVYQNTIEIFDFNTQTGQLSNPLILYENTPNYVFYGLEFSPDSNFLYAGAGSSYPEFESNLYQFNLSFTTSQEIQNSRHTLYAGDNYLSGIQLGPDKKIYITNVGASYLSIIHQPNEALVFSNYEHNALNIHSEARYGLPNFVSSSLLPNIVARNTCFGNVTAFSLTRCEEIISAQWNLGDGTSVSEISPTHTYSSPETYLVRVNFTTPSGTYNVQEHITIYDTPEVFPVDDFIVCDSGNGTSNFDLSTKSTEALGNQNNTDFLVMYYNSIEDAENHVNELPLNYTNTSNPEEVFVKVYHRENLHCAAITSFNLQVNMQPIANTVSDIYYCDDENNDQSHLVNLAEFNEQVLNGQDSNGVNISYHHTLNDANLGINELPLNYQTISNPETIFVRIENNEHLSCYDYTSFVIGIEGQLIAHQPDNIYTCDDASNDGFAIFDLSSQDNAIINGQTIPVSVSYYRSQLDANSGTNSLNATSFQNETNPQQIFARIQNSSNVNCYDTTSFFIDVLETPVVEDETVYICSGESVTLFTETSHDAYLWSTGQVMPQITVHEPGTYSVTVTNYHTVTPFTSCDATKTFTVIASATAQNITIETSDWTENNNTILVTVSGIGDYEYSLDNINFQDSALFESLTSGDYTVYVRDKNGCGIVDKQVFLLHYPKYFTPNGDGYHDYWQVNGANSEPNMMISIFDRYGKLMTVFSALSQGWDGTYNGNDMPASDYWFIVKRPNTNSVYRGHFTLKR